MSAWKRNRLCTVCQEPSVGRVCRTCFQRKHNKGKYVKVKPKDNDKVRLKKMLVSQMRRVHTRL